MAPHAVVTSAAAAAAAGAVRRSSVARATSADADLSRLPIHVCLCGLTIVSGVTTVVLRAYEPASAHNTIAALTGAAGVALIAELRYLLRLPWMSAPVVYLSLMWIFHFGMTFTALLAPSVLSGMSPDALEWFYLPSTRMAMVLGLLGAAGFALGTGFHASTARRPAIGARRTHSDALWVGGWAIMLAAIAAIAGVFIQNGGLGVFSMPYLEFRTQLLRATWLPNFIELSQLGCVLALCGAAGRRWRWPVAVWSGLVAAPMLLIGSRATAMIPLAVFAVTLVNRGVRLRPAVVALAVLVASMAVPAVYAYRAVGFTNRDLVDWTDVTPLDAVTEMGGSLQATRAYVDWIAGGDPHLLGASYWAPIDRQVLVRLVPGREPIPYADDRRIPLRLMDEREGAIGGSATGEAYYNFGPVGPPLYFAAVGLLVGWLDRRHAHTPSGAAALGVVMLAFFFNIRSDWLAVPSQVGQGLSLILACHAGALLLARPTRHAR